MKLTYKKSWARSLLMLDLTLGSFKVKQGHATLSAYKSHIFGPGGLECENSL